MELIPPAMSHAFSFKSGLLTLSLGFAAAFAVLTPAPEAQAGDKIKCDDIKFEPLKAMCGKADGKPKAVRDVMKAAQLAYNAAQGGDDVKCLTCHDNGKGEGLKADESKKYWNAFSTHLKTMSEAWPNLPEKK